MSEDDSTVLEATDVPSTTFLSKVFGIDDLEDVFKSGSEGDLETCETFCRRLSDGTCTGVLNERGNNLMFQIRKENAAGWVS